MNKFKVGDKVMCVDEPIGHPDGEFPLGGVVYNVSAVDVDGGIDWVGLSEFDERKGEWGAYRFELVESALPEAPPLGLMPKNIWNDKLKEALSSLEDPPY